MANLRIYIIAQHDRSTKTATVPGRRSTRRFTDINNIKPAGSKKVKITFNSIANGNQYLNSKIPSDNGYQVNIPISLIFSYDVINLENKGLHL